MEPCPLCGQDFIHSFGCPNAIDEEATQIIVPDTFPEDWK